MPNFTQRSWLSVIQEADPKWDDENLRRPIAYKFSNDRTFRERADGPYNSAAYSTGT